MVSTCQILSSSVMTWRIKFFQFSSVTLSIPAIRRARTLSILKVVLLLFTYPLTIAHASSIGLNSQWYGGSQSTACPASLAMLLTTYDMCLDLIWRTFWSSWGFIIGLSISNPFDNNHVKISFFFVWLVGIFSDLTLWYGALSMTITELGSRRGMMDSNHSWKLSPFTSSW